MSILQKLFFSWILLLPLIPSAQEIQNIEVEEDGLPAYDALRLEGESSPMQGRFLESLPVVLDEDVMTTGVVFPEVPAEAPYYRLTLKELIDLALESNFDLETSRRDITIARSTTRGAEAEFIPFADLVPDASVATARNEDAERTATGPNGLPETRGTVREQTDYSASGAIESGVTLPTGGTLSATVDESYQDTRTSDGGGSSSSSRFEAGADIRYIQPLLRGAGSDVATAELRRARIDEISTLLGFQLDQRDVVLDVITTYFGILQTARQLQVSRDAIAERARLLEETTIRYNVGRVDESEILRAEIQYLSELEQAIGRRRDLDDQKDELLLLLGLPLDTEISLVEITTQLAEMGRVDIPDPEIAVREALASRLELMRSDLTIASQEISYRVALNNVLPDLDLNAGYQRSDSGNDLLQAQGFQNSGFDAGISARIPLINIERRESAKRAGLTLDNARTNHTQLERSIIRDVLRTHRAVLATEAQLTILQKNVEQARKTLDLINGRFEVGFATITEVRLQQDDLFEAETRYNNTLLNYQIQLARFYVAVGRSLY